MSDSDPGRARRAFEPADDQADGVADHELDGDAAASEPGNSRDWAPTEDASAEAPEVSTPIPPPAPTLPEPPQPPASGRRFSAEERSEDWVTAAPRRSAVSVSSPPPTHDDPPTTDDGPDAAGDPDAGGPPPSDETAASDGRPGHGGRLIAMIAGVVVLAVIIGLAVWFNGQQPSTTGTPTAEPTAVAPESPSESAPAPGLDDTALLAASELGKLRASTKWTQDAGPSAAAQSGCVDLTTLAVPEAGLSRSFTANKAGGVLLQNVQTWPDAATASTAYAELLTRVGGCEGALLRNAYQVDKLADDASALTLALPDGTAHTLLISRTGRYLALVDASLNGDDWITVSALGRAVSESLARQCQPAGGTCPGTPKPVATVPQPTQDAGWLAWVDLPLINAGSGSWTATDPQAPKLVGSQCEDVDLNKLPDSTSSAHRTYLLTDDPDAPQGFGIDQAVYTFAKSSQASALAKKLKANFDGCGDRTRTASVKDAEVKAAGPDGKELTATSFTVTQRISTSKTVTFRVGVAAVGDRLVYLLANPSGKFDFSDAEWSAIVGRAAQRVTQAA